MSDDRLDERYVPDKIRRPRLFHQIRSTGSSPTKQGRHHRKGVYERVHQEGAFQSAKDWFESPLWDLLTTPSNLNRVYLTGYIERELQSRGWFRADAREMAVGSWIFKGEEPAFESLAEGDHDAMVNCWAALPGLQGISLISALYRLAHSEFNLAAAEKLSGALYSALKFQVHLIPIPGKLKERLYALIADRILYDIWISEPDMPQQPDQHKSSRTKRIRQFWDWYLARARSNRHYGCSDDPIVLDTPRTQWLRRNIEQLHPAWEKARVLDRIDSHFGARDGQTFFASLRDERIRQALETIEPMPEKADELQIHSLSQPE